jgi:hypothetical protein
MMAFILATPARRDAVPSILRAIMPCPAGACEAVYEGAKVQLGADVTLPDRFKLDLTAEAELKRRRGDFLGVALREPLAASQIKAARPIQPRVSRRGTWR